MIRFILKLIYYVQGYKKKLRKKNFFLIIESESSLIHNNNITKKLNKVNHKN